MSNLKFYGIIFGISRGFYEKIMDLNDQFHNLIESANFQDFFKHRKQVVKIITKAYRKVKSDRTIPKILSLKL